MPDEADVKWQLRTTPCILLVAGVAEVLCTSYSVIHEKNPSFPTDLELRSKVTFSINPRSVTFPRLTATSKVQLFSSCPPRTWPGGLLELFSVLF